MTVAAVVRRVLAHPMPVLIGVLVGVLAAGAVSWVMPRQYVASASVYIAGVDTTQAANSDSFASMLLVQQRMASYKDLMGSAEVVVPAATRAGVAGGAVSASSTPNSSVLVATASGTDAPGTAALANAAAARFGEVLAQVERPGNPARPPSVTSTVIAPAVVPSEAASPRTTLNILAGGLVGLLAAIAFVVYRAVTDTTVRTPAGLAGRAGGVALGVLPGPHGGRGSSGRPDPRASDEAVRRLRARLSSLGGDGPQVVVLASPNPGEGTTATVYELGRAIARTGRVLVVDGDLRRPALTARLGLDHAPGLGDVLRGDLAPDEVIRSHDGVDVVGAGPACADADVLLTSRRAAEVVARWREQYDRVLVDGAPLEPVIDAAVLARCTDGVVLLAQEGVTEEEAVVAAAAVVRDAGAVVLGSVLTGASAAITDYGPSVAPAPEGLQERQRPSSSSTAGAPQEASAGTHDAVRSP